MASTPPSGDSPAPAPASGPGRHHHDRYQQQQDRIRRNVACISCRDSKVRCRQSAVSGQPCQRCAKLQLECVYDRSHKRVTKRSKLELLEQELKSIKQAVNPRGNGDTPWSPPTPRVNSAIYPREQPKPPSLLQPEARTQPQEYRDLGPTTPRVLNDTLISGEDIDWYFQKYLQCFHPYLPVLRKKKPNECYAACPILFWAVLYVASRRYARDEALNASLNELLNRDVWAAISAPAHDLETIHTLLVLCAWPFPSIRFVTDPSSTFVSIALNSCLQLGLHTGRGSHPRYCIGGRLNMHFTDEEASVTWMFCCIVAQRTSASAGLPPLFLQHNDAQCRRVMQDRLAPELMILFDLAKFSNRLHAAMAAHVADHAGVSEGVVRAWEDDFESLQALASRLDSDPARFLLLAAQLEVQSYYFASPPGTPRPNFALNALRVYNTARALLSAGLGLEARNKLLTHGTHWIYRAVIDACCILLSTLHSAAVPAHLTPAEADEVAASARRAVLACSVRDADLPARAAVILETFWSVRNVLARFAEPAAAWPERLGGSVTYCCLTRFREALQEAKRSAEGVNKGLEAFHGPAGAPQSEEADQPVANGPDLFQELDWSMFLDEFSWGEGAVFLGPA